MKKVTIDIVKDVKVDNRVNNTGRPVNKKSARQIRLNKQALYSKLNKQFIQGKKFKISKADSEFKEYVYHVDTDSKRKNAYGHISSTTGHECNISYIGRTKVQGYTFVLGKKVNVQINLKNVKFV